MYMKRDTEILMIFNQWLSPYATAVVLSILLPAATYAAAPQVKGQAPGYYRMMLGDFEITALSDGMVALPMTKLLTNSTPARLERALARSYLKDPVETSVNGYLINTGPKLVLVDTEQ